MKYIISAVIIALCTSALALSEEAPECRLKLIGIGWHMQVSFGAGEFVTSSFDQALLKIYQLQRHGQCKVDWAHIESDCRKVLALPANCDSL
jgi:hypothetical protein